jgi:hypothetical protein
MTIGRAGGRLLAQEQLPDEGHRVRTPVVRRKDSGQAEPSQLLSTTLIWLTGAPDLPISISAILPGRRSPP